MNRSDHNSAPTAENDFGRIAPDQQYRALVTHEGQQLVATIVASADLLEDRLVMSTFDRFPSTAPRSIGAVTQLLEDVQDLGRDCAGAKHLWSPTSNLLWVIDENGQVEIQIDLDEHEGKDVRIWTHFVADRRGWDSPGRECRICENLVEDGEHWDAVAEEVA